MRGESRAFNSAEAELIHPWFADELLCEQYEVILRTQRLAEPTAAHTIENLLTSIRPEASCGGYKWKRFCWIIIAMNPDVFTASNRLGFGSLKGQYA